MIIRIKYENPQNLGEFIIESLDSSQVSVPQYCESLHKTKLCTGSSCTGEHCKIWVEIDDEFILAGVID